MYKKFTIAAVCTLMVLGGCADKTLQSVHTHDLTKSYALTDGRSDSLTLSMTIQCPEMSITEQALKLIKTSIKTAIFGEGYSVLNIEDSFNVFADSLAKRYRETNLDFLSQTENQDYDGILSWEYIASGEFTGLYKDYTTYTVSKYSYFGGAHGNSWTDALVFDLKDGHVIEEHELFKEDYKPFLSSLLTIHAKADAESSDSLTLLVSEIEPNGNFEVSEKCITYIYNPYDIAPYSSGTIRISIPWSELSPILK